MKLARIEHWKCGEPVGWKNTSGSTYVWVPDDMTEDELDNLSEAARKAYLAVEEEFKKISPPYPPGYGASVEHYPDAWTVAQIKADHSAKEKVYYQYQDKAALARKPFSWHLQQASGGTIKLFWEIEPAISTELHWGHQHGTTIEYGATQFGDYPPDEDDGL